MTLVNARDENAESAVLCSCKQQVAKITAHRSMHAMRMLSQYLCCASAKSSSSRQQVLQHIYQPGHSNSCNVIWRAATVISYGRLTALQHLLPRSGKFCCLDGPNHTNTAVYRTCSNMERCCRALRTRVQSTTLKRHQRSIWQYC
jgi:hypothetical protein